ncbi:MAG: FmdB family zinc ribbon protein [Actinomycetes bacterium]
MPTYEYACNACGHAFEMVQAFSDEAISICPECGGEVRKVYSNVGVVFKGSGFYKTDSRTNGTKTESTSTTAAPAAPPAPAAAPKTESSAS